LPLFNSSSTSEARLINEPAFSVIGLTAKTSNQAEMSGSGGRLGPLWRNFMAETDQYLPGDPDRSTIFCVYTDYESDENGPYRVILGRSVSDSNVQVPHGLERIDIGDAQYLVFKALDRNPESVQEAWSRVHDYFRSHPSHRRAFTADFDKYGPNGVDLYVAVR
jgi:predicted transcriptional regulator YdeE